MAELAAKYEKSEPVHRERPPLSPKYFRMLVENSEDIRARLDVLCRFVLVMHGIAKDPYEGVAAQLGISQIAIERAYCVAFDTLDLASDQELYNADVPMPCHINGEPALAGSTD